MAGTGRGRAVWRSRAGVVAIQLGVLLIILVGWQFGVSRANEPFFSRPSLVVERLAELFIGGEIYRHIRVTLTEIVVGYALGAAVGLILGFALGRSRFLSDTLQPYIIGMYSIPKIALAPLFIVWLGLGIESKIAVVVLASFFLIFFNTYAGLQNIDEELVKLARLMGASWTQTIRRVILPASAHSILIGFKTAVPYAVIGAVIGEYIGASEGLGHFIMQSSQLFDAPGLFSGIIILVLIVFVANYGLTRLERRLIRWRPSEQVTVQM